MFERKTYQCKLYLPILKHVTIHVTVSNKRMHDLLIILERSQNKQSHSLFS